MAKIFGWHITRERPTAETVTKTVYVGAANFVELIVAEENRGYDRSPLYYAGCEQALSEHPNGRVSIVRALEVDGKLFLANYGLQEITVQPKPKVDKGK